MENRIREILSKYNGMFSVIIKDSFGNRISINEDRVFLSASIIKLYILSCISKSDYNKIIRLEDRDKVEGNGLLKSLNSGLEFTVKDLVYFMICLSDNTATNILIDYLGMENINRFIKENGYCDTILGRKMMDSEAKKMGKDNFTSSKDSEKVLDILCNDEDCLDMLKNQACNNKLHLYIPEEEILAHKTGELPSVEHDVGRLYFKNGWVDILVFTQGLKKNIDGIFINNEIGKIVYEYYKNRGY